MDNIPYLLAWNDHIATVLNEQKPTYRQYCFRTTNKEFPTRCRFANMFRRLVMSRSGDNATFEFLSEKEAKTRFWRSTIVTDMKYYDVEQSIVGVEKFIFGANSFVGLSRETIKSIIAPEYYPCHVSHRVEKLGYYCSFAGAMVATECVCRTAQLISVY